MADVAALIGVQAVTIRTYKRDSRIPPPDGYLGRSPWWWETTIVAWQETRPGQGARTDTRKGS